MFERDMSDCSLVGVADRTATIHGFVTSDGLFGSSVYTAKSGEAPSANSVISAAPGPYQSQIKQNKHSMADSRKTVLITGCSAGGIGNALAREFASKGLRVFATARQAESIADLRSHGIEPLSLEVHKQESIDALKAQVQSLTGGKLDYLVNNAGRNYTVPGLEIDLDELRLTFEINVFAVMRMCQAFAPLLIAAKGRIIQIGSVAAVVPYVFGSAYNASKAALHQYSNTLRVVGPVSSRDTSSLLTTSQRNSLHLTSRSSP